MARRPPRRQIPSWIQQNLPEELAESAIFCFQITLPNQQAIEVDLRPDVDVDYDQLEAQLEQCPAQYVYWAAIYSELRALAALLERKIKARRGKLVDEAVGMTAKGEVPKLTKDQISMIVEQDKTLNDLEAHLIQVNTHVGKMFHMTLALQMKSEHLRSLAGFKRAERDAQR